ncbi:fructosamine kinase family protein [Ilumatobacter nonamiensis]|uniref:fructosamine kinase family protein n=1 Tax=Ilumatobacter nonamiensis TaxID=467093 RepID=UPI0003463A89|nr:fructosamine kinase family protein [Ilumatobacter nonamiensis]
MDELIRRIGDALDRSVLSLHRLSGGDVAEAFRVELTDGDRVFAKTHAAPPPHFFPTEATGLGWLREAAVASHAPIAVPGVLGVAEDLLVLEWIDEAPSARSTEVDLGRALARIHRVGAPSFGRSDRRTTGSRALPNEPCSNWSEFYAVNRLEPLARLARDGRALDERAIGRLDAIADRLASFDAADEPPALLHGDLWAGNRLVGSGGVNWLIDPAAHGGHREFDLAMMALFGGFGDECWTAYDDEYPLSPGWQDRVPLHQLAPLVVHAIKFGNPYPVAVDRALDACDRL